MLACSSQAFSAIRRCRPEMRIQRLENQLRQLTGQNEELQYRNRQLEERLRRSAAAPAGARRPAAGRPAQRRAVPPAQLNPIRRAAVSAAAPSPARICPAAADRRPRADHAGPGSATGGRPAPWRCLRPQPESERSRCAARARRRPVADRRDAPVGAPGGRGAGEPLDLGGAARAVPVAPCRLRRSSARLRSVPPARADHIAAVGDAQGRVRPRHRLHAAQGLCAGRRDHEEFCAEIPTIPDRDRNTGSAKAFSSASNIATPRSLSRVTTKYDKSAKAPDALLRLGQSLAALKEKEAACAALGEVTQKYPRASAGVK